MSQNAPVERTTKGLQSMLFNTIDKVEDGSTTPQHGRTLCSLATALIATARLEMDHARFVSDARARNQTAGLVTLPAVALGTK